MKIFSAGAYTKNQLAKLGNSIIFLLDNIPAVTKNHLLSLIFILEEESVCRFGIPFFNLRFEVWKSGPVAPDVFVELSDEPHLLSGYLRLDYTGNPYRIVPVAPFRDDEFNDNEMVLLEEIVKYFKHCTVGELARLITRKNTLWYNTALKYNVLGSLEKGEINTTDIEIDFSELLANEQNKLDHYNDYKTFLQFSQNIKS